MNYNYNHERFVNKNKSIASGYFVDKHDKELEEKGFSRHQRQEDASCFNCKLKAKCSEFRTKRTGGSLGVASFDGRENFICDRYIPAPVKKKAMSDRQIKSLLKNIKKGRS
jgi:hypothetical protein